MKAKDTFKKMAALHAVDQVSRGMVLGLGSGSTTRFALEEIGSRIRAGLLSDISGIPSSSETESLAHRYGIPLTSFGRHTELDLTIDGADEVDTAMNLIKGGGGALLREKVIAQASRRVIIIVDDGKLSRRLGTNWPVPVEVVQFAWQAVAGYLESLGCSVSLRKKSDDSPYTTDGGNFILDCSFGPIEDPAALAQTLSARAGIMEHGLFIGLATEVIVAGTEGVRTINR